ncbi:MAG: hypothetical protein NC324_03180 [Bacteroides sp.]|nr:hypothetical protein [Bacteroides sp.]
MTYAEYIEYHKQGDAGVEERMISSLCRHFRLSEWDSFQLIYFYTMTYHIPSALDMLLEGQREIKRLHFRTDRRYVRCNGAFPRLLEGLSPEKFHRLAECKTTQQAYDYVRTWYFFGRYAAYLFLEVYCNVFSPEWKDDVRYEWEREENYTKGAISIVGSNERAALDKFLREARKDTGDNAFALETSLCAVAKFNKGTRWNGYYTERMIQEAGESPKYGNIIMQLVK